jgi:hypothetical protein
LAFLHLAFVALLVYLPGRLMIRNLSESARSSLVDENTALPLGCAFSYFLISTIQLATTWTGWPPLLANSSLYLAAVAILWIASRIRGAGAKIPAHPAAWSFALFVLYLLSLLLLLPSYKTSFSRDWGLYYPNTLAYLGRRPLSGFTDWLGLEYLVRRTPEMSLFGSFFVSLLGQSFDRFQVACLLPNAWVFWAVYLFGVRCFGRRSAAFALGILPLSPAVLRAATITEPKFVAACFALLSACFYLWARDEPDPARVVPRGAVAGALAVGATMCHPSMLFYSFWVGADQLYLRWRRRPTFLRAFCAGGCAGAAVLAAPWYAWIARSFGRQIAFHPTATLTQPLSLSLWEYAVTRLKMIIATLLVPSYLVDALRHGSPIPPSFTGPALAHHLRYWGNLTLRFYDQTFLGGMSVAVGLTLIVAGWWFRPRGEKRPGRAAIYLGMGLGAVICFFALLKDVDLQGNATNMTAPLFLLVLCYAGQVLGRLPKRAARVILAAAGLEMIANRLLTFLVTRDLEKQGLVYLYETARRWFAGPGMMIPILTAAAFLAAYLVSVRRLGVMDTLGMDRQIP